jgi:hypothetical protein
MGFKQDQFKITEGKSSVKICQGLGTMQHAICCECGTGIYQHPAAATFLGIFPVNFQIENGKSCMLPENMKPTCHLNYENRVMDCFDDLPKILGGNMGSERCNSIGMPLPGKHNEMKPIFVFSNRWVLEANK